uniref:Uncharacterized protein n=1 Tax=Pipistrellus kuhlii TaxID=59472 RepID=A0A7J7QS52_PIPKU|nr:hypothetical protein mPipKuh1_008748 [Pipistrellus kuhlii]
MLYPLSQTGLGLMVFLIPASSGFLSTPVGRPSCPKCNSHKARWPTDLGICIPSSQVYHWNRCLETGSIPCGLSDLRGEGHGAERANWKALGLPLPHRGSQKQRTAPPRELQRLMPPSKMSKEHLAHPSFTHSFGRCRSPPSWRRTLSLLDSYGAAECSCSPSWSLSIGAHKPGLSHI